MMGKDEAAPPLMTVRQLARQGDVTVHVVRNYLRRGLLQAATHTEGGYQLFAASELQRLHFIRTAQQLGFTLAEIEEIIRHSLQRHSPCPLVRDIIRRRLYDTRQGSTPKSRTVVKGLRTSGLALRLFFASSGCGTARCIRTHRPLRHRASDTSCGRSARA